MSGDLTSNDSKQFLALCFTSIGKLEQVSFGDDYDTEDELK